MSPVVPTTTEALALPDVSPRVTVPVPFPPRALLLVLACTVPARTASPPPKVLRPLKVNCEVELFSTAPVTFAPMTALTRTEPLPLPELVTVPALFTEVVESVMPLVRLLLLFRVRLPVPVTPPETVSTFVPNALTKVVPEAFTVTPPETVSAEVVLLSVTVVTFAPMPPLTVTVPVPAPVFVTVPALFTAEVEKVTVPVVAFDKVVRLLVPVTPPLKVVEMAVPVLPIVSVPEVPVARTKGLAKVSPVVPTTTEALALPEVSPRVTVPAPSAEALVLACTVPALTVSPPAKVFTPESVSCEVELFSTAPVTLVSMTALTRTEPLPLPELVTVPTLLTAAVEIVMPLARVLLLFSTRLPVPETPPETVSSFVPSALTKVVPEALIASAPETVSAEVVLLSVTAVTFAPMPPLTVTVPVPAPTLVTVPALLMALVENVTVPVVALALVLKLLVPVMPPLKVVEMAVPALPIVSVPDVPVAKTIGFA